MIIFHLPIKPLSVNQSLTPVNGRMVKSSKHRAYIEEINAYLCKYKTALKLLSDEQIAKDCAVKITYYVYCPKDEYYTKAGLVNKKRIDAANIEKNLTDAIMKFIGINDVYCNPSPGVIIIPKDKWCVVVEIELASHPTPEEFLGI